MKKRKINLTEIFKIGILFFGISILLWNCEKDEYIEVSSKESLIKKVSLNELLKRNEFNESYTKLLEKTKKETKVKQTLKGLYQKNEEEDLYNFKIDTSSILLTELDTVVSFAMSITRNKVNNEYFENLVLQRKNNENVQAYLFRYFYSGNSIQKNGIKTIKLDLDKINFSNKMLYEELCNDVFLNLCTGGNGRECDGSPHIPSGQCLDKYFHCIGPTYVGRTCSSGSSDVGDFSTDNNHTSTTNTSAGGGGTGIVVPVIFNTSPVKFYEIITSFEDAINFVPSRFESVETQFSYLGAVGKFLKQNNFYELGQVLFDLSINQTALNDYESSLLVSKTLEILTILKDVENFEELSLEDQKKVTKNFLFIDFLPNLKDLGIDLPQTSEEWSEFGEFLLSILKELIPELIPGVSELNSLKNAISAFSNGSYENGATELAFAIVGVFPVGKTWKIASKAFKGMKIVVRLTKAFKNAKKLKNLISSNYDEALKAFNKIGIPGDEGVRVLANSTENHGKTFFEQLTKNIPVSEIYGTKGKIFIAKFPDGSKIQYRNWASTAEEYNTKATIEFLGGNYTKNIQKIKFNE